MRNLLPLLWALLIFWIAGCTYWYVCHVCGHCGTATSAVRASDRVSSVYSHPFDIKDGSFSAKANDNIRFGENNAKPIIPDVVSTRLKETVTYAGKNNKSIDLIGYYMTGEDAQLGKQRAERVKAELVRFGADAAQVNTEGRLSKSLAKNMGQVHGALSLLLKGPRNITTNASSNIVTTTQVSEPVAAVKQPVKKVVGDVAEPEIREKLSAKDLNLYFESGSTNVIMTSEIRDYFDNLKIYLKANPSAKVRLIGHTDNEGSAASNLRYGRQRAERIKSKLMKGGIKGSQIVTESKGQTSPISSNDTDAGRKLNRRVEITIN